MQSIPTMPTTMVVIMFSAVFVIMVMMVRTFNISIEGERPCQIFYGFLISIAGYAAP